MTVNTSTGFEVRNLGPEAFDQIFRYGCIEVRTGPQPASADAPATGTLIARITRDGGAWVEGAPDNGLEFVRSGRYASKPGDHVWRLKGIATGVAGWFRLRGNAADAGGASLDLPRIDGLINTVDFAGDAQLFLTTLNLTASSDLAINNWWYARPPL